MKRIIYTIFFIVALTALAYADAVQFDFLTAGLTTTNGSPLAGAKVYTYELGTTTAKTTWTARDKSATQTNPITLDTYGKSLTYGQGWYKVVVKSSDLLTTYYTLDAVYIDSARSALYEVSTAAELSAAITAIGSSTAEISVVGNITVSAATTIPANVTTTVQVGGGFTKSGSGTITFNGPFQCGLYQAFTSFTGGVTFDYETDVFPQWFGAKCDNSTNDVQAVSDALDAVIASQGVLFIKGRCIVNDTSAKLTKAGIGNIKMSIIGESTHNSVLKFTGTNGLSLTSTNNDFRITISDLWFEAGYAGTDQAIYIEKPSTTSISHEMVKIKNVTVSPSVAGQGLYYFTTGIYINNVWQAVIEDVTLRGKTNTINTMIDAIKIGGQSTGAKINRARVWFAQNGVYVVTDSTSEGVYIGSGTFVYVDKGVFIDSDAVGTEPGHMVVNNHLNSYTAGIHMSRNVNVFISGNLIHKRPDSTNNYADILLCRVSNSTISNNVARNEGTAGTNTFIRMQSASNNNIIANNTFEYRDKGMWLDSTAACSSLAASDSAGNNLLNAKSVSPKAGFVYIDDDNTGADRNYWFNQGLPRYSKLALTAVEVIADITDTIIPWDKEVYSNEEEQFWTAGAPTKIVIPMHLAKVRLVANISWEANATGIRVVRILMNGTTVAQDTRMAASSGTTDQQITTEYINVIPGDYFEVQVYQNSGGVDLDVNDVYGATVINSSFFYVEAAPQG